MRTALCCALLGLAAGAAGAQEREVTFEAPKPVTVTGFAVGSYSWDREQATNSALASKLAVRVRDERRAVTQCAQAVDRQPHLVLAAAPRPRRVDVEGEHATHCSSRSHEETRSHEAS